MDKNHIEIRHKRWFRIGFYILAPVFVVLGAYIFGGFALSSESNQLPMVFNILMVSCGVVTFGLGLFGPAHFYKLKLIIDEEGITRKGLYNKELALNDIRQIKVGKGLVEVTGDRFYNAISFGNLYRDFDKAVAILAENIGSYSDINFKGNEEYIEKYFRS